MNKKKLLPLCVLAGVVQVDDADLVAFAQHPQCVVLDVGEI